MATFNFLDPTSANLSVPYLDASHRTQLSPTLAKAPWIYSNYPEFLNLTENGVVYGKAMAENGYYLNQQTVKGSAEIFYSHTNMGSQAIKFRIQIFNPNNTAATVTRSNVGHTTGWRKAQVAVEQFFSSTSKTITVPANGVAWLTDEHTVAEQDPFSGMVRFNANKDVVITSYIYYNASSIDGRAKTYEYKPSNSKNMGVYTGLGTGYFLTFNHGTISVSSLKSKSYQFVTNTNDHFPNKNEIVPISILGTNKVASLESSDGTLRNLANWGVHNFHKMTLKNDTAQAVTVYGYIGGNEKGTTEVINQAGRVKSFLFSSDITAYHTWKWCKITLAANETYSFDFQNVKASYGNAGTFYEWKLG